MRLIDADELRSELIKGHDLVGAKYVDLAPIIEPNLVINPEEIQRGKVIEIGEDIIVMHHKDYYDLLCEQFKVEPFEDAVRVYEYLKEKLGYEIVSDQKEFEAWFERMVWHVKRCDELGRMVCKDAISIEVAIQTTWMILNGMGYPKDQNEELDQTIKAVFDTAPRVLPNHSGEVAEMVEDAISREYLRTFFADDKGKGRHTPIDSLLALIDDAPSVVPSRPQGVQELVEGFAKALTYEDVITAEAEAKGYAQGFKDGMERWIPCSERLPNEGEVVLVCMRIESHKAEWEEQRSIEFGRISSDRYDYYGTGWEWLNESGADYWQADWDNSILAWMPLPKPWKGADESG